MKKQILVVDDEPEFTNVLKLGLEALGYYHVREENDARDALAAAREFAPDLIVLDVMMPDVDGSEVAARVRADPVLKDTPVIFMTALVLREEAPAGFRTSGGQTYLPKNVPIERLIECIEEKTRRRGHAPAAVAAAGVAAMVN